MTSQLLPLATALLALSGCSTPTSPTRHLFRTGQDARVYNPMTGRYEWPDEPDGPRAARLQSEPSSASATPAPNAGDERAYNPRSGRFEIER